MSIQRLRAERRRRVPLLFGKRGASWAGSWTGVNTQTRRRGPDVTQDDPRHRRYGGDWRRSGTVQHRGIRPLGRSRLGRWSLRLRQCWRRPRRRMGLARRRMAWRRVGMARRSCSGVRLARCRMGMAWRSCSGVGLARFRMGLAPCWVGMGWMGLGRCRPLRGRNSGRV
jgi:hypothetical protein